MTTKEKRELYNKLIELFDMVYDDPSTVNEACLQIYDNIVDFENKSYDKGYEDGYSEASMSMEYEMSKDYHEFKPKR